MYCSHSEVICSGNNGKFDFAGFRTYRERKVETAVIRRESIVGIAKKWGEEGSWG